MTKFQVTYWVHLRGHRAPQSPQGQGKNFVGGAVWKRPENVGSTLPSGLVGLALTKPCLWFCLGVRLPDAVEPGGGRGWGLFMGPRDVPPVEMGLGSSVP